MSNWNPEVDVLLTDSEDEEDDYDNPYAKGREVMLFVLDANLYRNQERFQIALEITQGAYVTGLMSNAKDLMGIVFANTEMSPEPYEKDCLENISVPDNCAVFLPVRQLTKPIIDYMIRFKARASKDFGTEFGIAKNGGYGNFSAMLRLCVNLLENCGYGVNNGTIVYITDRDTPHLPDSREYQWALQKAKDLEGKEIEFQVIPMVDDFNYNVFYKEFLTLIGGIELESFVPLEPNYIREMLTNRKLWQHFMRRTLGHFEFTLGPQLKISAQYYNYFKSKPSTYPKKVKIKQDDNSVVRQKRVLVVRDQFTDETQIKDERLLKSTAAWYEINLGRLPIKISSEQMKRVRNLHEPGMMLLGFQPQSLLPKNMYYKLSNFMYPDDKAIIGSKRLFKALWQRCLERERVAICLFMRKRRSLPRYVALKPVTASKDGSIMSGDGFQIIYLPLAKHIRSDDYREWISLDNEAPTEGVDLFKKIIKKLRIKYEPSLMNDPDLELIQSRLLALAFDIRTDGPTEMADPARQDERISRLLPSNLDEIFGTDAEVAKKRPAKSALGAGLAKIAKITQEDIARYDFVEDLIAKKNVESCTVPQLRFILNEHFGVKTSLKTKQCLLDEIYDKAANT